MIDFTPFLSCLAAYLSPTTLRQMACILPAMLAITGRVTMKGLSRWALEGASYRTIQRFFHTVIAWKRIHWLFIRHHLLDPDDVYLVAGDEVVVSKAGKDTFGLGRFYSSLCNRPIPGLCFLTLSLISVKHRTSYPLCTEQLVKDNTSGAPKEVKSNKKNKRKTKQPANQMAGSQETDIKASPASVLPTSPRAGRPKGSKNRSRVEVELSPFLLFLQRLLLELKALLNNTLSVRYFLYDGELGHNDAAQMVRKVGWHLISKLRFDSALFFPFEGPYAGRGPKRKYGDRLDYNNLPDRFLMETTCEDSIETRTYQMPVWHKLFPEQLNVAIIVKTNLLNLKTARVILFSTDLSLGFACLIDYYRLRFQLEFNFRDAKQYWGLEDFMVTDELPVYNSANLAFFMINLSQVLIRPKRRVSPDFSINDLKSLARGTRYVLEILKLLPVFPHPIVIDRLFSRLADIGAIHPSTG